MSKKTTEKFNLCYYSIITRPMAIASREACKLNFLFEDFVGLEPNGTWSPGRRASNPLVKRKSQTHPRMVEWSLASKRLFRLAAYMFKFLCLLLFRSLLCLTFLLSPGKQKSEKQNLGLPMETLSRMLARLAFNEPASMSLCYSMRCPHPLYHTYRSLHAYKHYLLRTHAYTVWHGLPCLQDHTILALVFFTIILPQSSLFIHNPRLPGRLVLVWEHHTVR